MSKKTLLEDLRDLLEQNPGEDKKDLLIQGIRDLVKQTKTEEHPSLPTPQSDGIRGNAGSQGIAIRPVGSFKTNPFTSQDAPSQDADPSASSQPAPATPASSSPNAPSSSIQNDKES